MRRFISALAIPTLCTSGGVAFAQHTGTKDGTTDNATIKANACTDHGGVKVDAKVKS